ncbi:Uncharacterised protein [uncultured archaeon]|nr:Uncharacterised protein [uncultured archaeon]
MDLDTVIRSFRNGFDWLSDRNAYIWFGALVVLWTLAYSANAIMGGTEFRIAVSAIDYAMKFVGLFMIVPIALKHYGIKTGFGSVSLKNVTEWVKYTVVNSVVPFFNWQDRRMLMAQIVIAVAGVLLWFGGFDQQIGALNALDPINPSVQALDGINLTIVALGLLVLGLIWLLQMYNSIRYALLIQVRLSEGKDIMDSVGKAWKLTKGNFVTTLLLFAVWSIFSYIVGWAASFIGNVLPFFNGIVFSFMTVTWAYVFTGLYVSLKGSAYAGAEDAAARKTPPVHAVRKKKRF